MGMGTQWKVLFVVKPKIPEQVVIDPFNEGGHWEDFKGLLTIVAIDATIEQLLPK